jgi:hypothetical protein
MKKLLLALVATMFIAVGSLMAEEGGAYFKAGNLSFTYPLSNASVISLYDWWSGEGLLGVETSIANYKALNLNFGAVTSFQSNGMPFLSLDLDIAKLIVLYPRDLSKMGIWAGHDFKTNENRAGIKATVSLW